MLSLSVKRSWILLVLLLSTWSITQAQNLDRDTNYIAIPNRAWNLRLHQVNKYYLNTFQTKNTELPVARYRPNENPGIGIAGFRKSLGVWLAVNLPSPSSEIEERGNQIHYDFQINQYGRKFGVDLQLQYFKGFYLSNPPERILGNEERLIARPDLTAINLGLHGYWVFNWKKYSIRSAFIQSEIQRKTAGSFVLGGGYTRHFFDADSAILPSQIRQATAVQAFQSGIFHDLQVNPGYMFTLVVKGQWYLTASGHVGLGAVFRRITSDQGQTEEHFSWLARLQGRLAAGYNGNRYFSGVSWIGNQYAFTLEDADLQYRWGILRFFIGYRPEWGS